MKKIQNAILARETIPALKLEQLGPDKLVFRGEEESVRRTNVELFRKQEAREFLGELRPGMHLFGLSKGQFSLIDLIEAITEQIPEIELTLSTWTAASANLSRLEAMIAEGRFVTVRFLFDFSFQRRQPGLIHEIRKKFGAESIRILKNHAKFLLIKSGDWRLVVRTSMNLNMNPRLEDIDVADDPALFDFLDSTVRKIFAHHDPHEQPKQTIRQHNLEFARFR